MSLIRKWSVRDTDSMTTLLETWRPALPAWVLENIVDQLVLPRLLQEVENWNPLTDTTPIHCWLHPWLPLMGESCATKLAVLFVVLNLVGLFSVSIDIV